MTTSEDFIPERRRCSDKVCNDARTEWVKDTLWPQMRMQIAAMIGATVVFCTGIFLYLAQNTIRDYDVRAREKYLSIAQHERDISRIEVRIEKMEASIVDHMLDVRKALDRNLQAIQGRR